MLAIGCLLRGAALVLIVAVWVGLGSTSARPQDTSDPDALTRQIQQLYQARKYAEATPLAEKNVVLARERYGEDRA
jgi:hypothetical protein